MHFGAAEMGIEFGDQMGWARTAAAFLEALTQAIRKRLPGSFLVMR